MRRSKNILWLLLLAGCVGKTVPSLPPEKQVALLPPDREFPVAIHLASHQVAAPATPIAPEYVYGLWLREQGNIRTWLRIESPRIHLALIDKDQGIGRVLDGEYNLTRDGSLFSVITSEENIRQKERVEALYRG